LISNRKAKAFAAEIAALVPVDPLWAELDKTIRSFKGCAEGIVAVLIADLPELGTISNKAITKLVGLAPLAALPGQAAGSGQGKDARPNRSRAQTPRPPQRQGPLNLALSSLNTLDVPDSRATIFTKWSASPFREGY
jgi:hypothetical protein